MKLVGLMFYGVAMTWRIVFILFFVYTPGALAEWVEIYGLNREEQWKLPAQSAGKVKYLWQRYIVTKAGEKMQVTEIRKYDCYALKFHLIQAQGNTKTGTKISLPVPPTWYRITPGSEHHIQLVQNEVCPN